MSSVRIVFDLSSSRWELVRDGLAGAADLVEELDGVLVARALSGEVVELVIDVDEPGPLSAPVFDLLTDAFGESIANLVATIDASAGVDVVVDTSVAVPSGAEVAASRAAGPAGPMAGEPGSLVLRADGRFEIALENSSAHVEVTPTGMVVSVPGIVVEGWWVRVSDSGSGTLLALGPLRPGAEVPSAANVESGVATISFGLNIDPETTLVTVTTDPLRPLPSRLQRRQAWIDGLLASARRSIRSHPATAARDARGAADAAAQLGDSERRQEAETLLRRAHRWRWLRPFASALGVAGLIAAAVMVTLWLTRNDDPPVEPDASNPVTVTSPTITNPTITVPEVTGPAERGSERDDQASRSERSELFVGPSTYVFGDESSVQLRLVGTAQVEQGTTLTLDAVGTISFPDVDFGDRSGVASDDAEARARASCLGAVNVPADRSTFVPPLDTDLFVTFESVDGDDVVGLGQVALSGAVRSTSSDAASCRAGEMGPDGKFLAAAVATRQAEVVQFEIPGSVAPGRWRLTFSSNATLGVANAPLVIDVAPPS